MSGSDRPAAVGDGAMPSALNFPAVVQGGGFTRFEAPMAPMPAAFGSAPVFARGDVPMAAPADLGWKPAPADVLPPPTGDVPKVDALKPADAGPTVTVGPVDANKPADVLVRADNTVVYREGLTGNEANIRIAYEEGASKEAIQKAAVDAGNMQASHLPEGVNAPRFIDETAGKVAFDKDFESKFNSSVKEHMPKPKPDGGKDGKDEDDIKPPPDNNGGDCRPNPNPKPNPDDNNIKPDGDDKVKPDKDDIDSIVNGKSKADQTRDFTTKFGDTLLKSGGLHPAYYGQFLSSFMTSPKIRDLLKRLADGDPNAEKELEDALKAEDGKEMKDISAGLDKQIKALTDAGDKDGAAALTGFKKQLLGEDGKTPNMAMFKEIATFQQKVEKGEAGPSDVAKLFSPGDNPSNNVQRAICDLAALCAGTQRKQISPVLPTDLAARKKAIEEYQKAVKDTLIDLQIKPTAFTDLFKR